MVGPVRQTIADYCATYGRAALAREFAVIGSALVVGWIAAGAVMLLGPVG